MAEEPDGVFDPPDMPNSGIHRQKKEMTKSYSICARCIMDTSDPNIRFDDHGLCEYCNNFDAMIKPNWGTGDEGVRQLSQIAA